MAQNTDPVEQTEEQPKKKYAVHSGLIKEYAEDRYHRQNDQRARWQAEHQHHEAIEKALADVSKFSYEQETYLRNLVKESFREPVRSDFQSLLPERMMEAEQRYRRPILIQWALMAALLLSIAFFPYMVTIALAAVLLAIVGFLHYKTLRERKTVLDSTETETRLEIEAKVQQQDEEIAELRRIHDEAEEERIKFYIRLMNGDEDAIITTLDEYLPEANVPFPMDVDIDIHEGILMVKAWLPPKALLPAERTSLSETGKIRYDKKSSTELNKQYAELCAAILMQITSLLFSKIPTMEGAYVWGIQKEEELDECVMSMWVDRSHLTKVSRASSALAALQGLSAVYECDEQLKLLPVEPLEPQEWAELEEKDIRTLRIKIYKWMLPGMGNKIVENN